ncbi:MAG: PQQ-binding-like beta-propeller repeat protein [Theionarchaea archaeon]|nr:PQQ-binding-like beta-propeller repeat protein [Theionarchaea archaeon]
MNCKVFLVVCLILISSGTVRSPSQALLWKISVDGKVRSIEMPVDNVLPVLSNNLSGLDIETGNILWDSEIKGWPGDCSDFETDAGILFTSQGPFAIDPKTGEILWVFKVEDYGSYHAVGYGKLFVTEFNLCLTFGFDYSDRTSIMAFDEFTGTYLWSFDACSPITSDIEVGKGFVTFVCRDGTVYALDHETGTPVWTVETGEEVWTSPVIAGDRLLVPSDALYCIDMETGQVIWTLKSEKKSEPLEAKWSNVVVIQDKVLSSSETLYCIDLVSGSVLWKKFSHPFTTSNERAYAFTGSGYACLDLVDGSVLWTYEREGVPFGGVVVHGADVVFAVSSKIVVLDALTGDMKWSYDVSEPISCPPLVLDNFIVIGTEEAHVIAFGTPEQEVLPPCEKNLDLAKRSLFKKEYEHALRMLESARILCTEDMYPEIDALSDYARSRQEKSYRNYILIVGVCVLICSLFVMRRLGKE